MLVINQPFQGKLGDIITAELKNDYSSFTIFSAFAKNSGILRLKEAALEKYRSDGGMITAFIGVDLDGTSYEALQSLRLLCDRLFIIHSESFGTTFHSKIYLLENQCKAWCAVGSNNLTCGGLWTNFESCGIETFSLPEDSSKLDSIHEIMKKYMDPNYSCSKEIKSDSDIDILLKNGYVTKELQQKINNLPKPAQKSKHDLYPVFGKEKIPVPKLSARPELRAQDILPSKDINRTHIQSVSRNEQFWFEARGLTGGSRNILDLSKRGVIAFGSAKGTSYEYPSDPNKMYGGIKFFEIDPDDTSREKDIKINYDGKDYFPSTIKFAKDNGSWRIQLKGQPNDNSEELSKFDFKHKILVFEKVSSNYYILSLLDESELDNVKSISRVWAYNGNNRNSKAYGMFY